MPKPEVTDWLTGLLAADWLAGLLAAGWLAYRQPTDSLSLHVQTLLIQCALIILRNIVYLRSSSRWLPNNVQLSSGLLPKHRERYLQWIFFTDSRFKVHGLPDSCYGYESVRIHLSLCVYRKESVVYYSNRDPDSPRSLAPGTYCMSNSLLNSPWLKVTHGKKRFSEIISSPSTSLADDLFALLCDDTW